MALLLLKPACLSHSMWHEASVRVPSKTKEALWRIRHFDREDKKAHSFRVNTPKTVTLQMRLKLMSFLRFHITLHFSLANIYWCTTVCLPWCYAVDVKPCIRTQRLDSSFLHSNGEEGKPTALQMEDRSGKGHSIQLSHSVGYSLGAPEIC